MKNEELKILKLGGALITDKKRGVFNAARIDVIDEICKAISSSKNLILVHGAGSFGHPYVEKYKLKEIENLKGILETHMACKSLNKLVCESLIKNDVIPFPIHPFSSFKVGDKLIFDSDFLNEMIKKGLVPVTHGDFVFNIKNLRFEVLSGDKIVIEFANQLNVDRVGFATDVEGVYVDGKVVEEINRSNIEKFLSKIDTTTKKSDVTGGMRGKILNLLKLRKVKAYVFKGTFKNVKRFLNGKDVGTKIILD